MENYLSILIALNALSVTVNIFFLKSTVANGKAIVAIETRCGLLHGKLNGD